MSAFFKIMEETVKKMPQKHQIKAKMAVSNAIFDIEKQWVEEQP